MEELKKVGLNEVMEKIKKVGLDPFNELAESHEAHIRQVKKLEEELNYYKQLDCEGVDASGDKGKITYVEKSFGSFMADGALLELIEWIQETQSEMDLQTKTSKEILEEYYENS
jgi:hypothetical protein